MKTIKLDSNKINFVYKTIQKFLIALTLGVKLRNSF